MTRAAQIRHWLADNPGWHFAGDVADGMDAQGPDRKRLISALGQMTISGTVRFAGKHGSMRYAAGRPARKYTQRAG